MAGMYNYQQYQIYFLYKDESKLRRKSFTVCYKVLVYSSTKNSGQPKLKHSELKKQKVKNLKSWGKKQGVRWESWK